MTRPQFIAGYLVHLSGSNEPRYLLLQRARHSYLPGIWQMVTGKVKEDETVGRAVEREILEETGLICSKIYNVDVTMFYEQLKDRIAFSANFCAFTDSESVLLSAHEHDSYKWCTLSEACELLAFPAQKETLRFIHNHYVLQKPDPVNLLKL